MAFHLAQVNIARLVAPLDDPRISGFVAQLEPINALAEAAPGFVWRLQSDSGNATDIPYSDDPLELVSMSVWESVESLRDFVYRSSHLQVFRDRSKWFEKQSTPYYCLWWIPAGHIPAVEEARQRLKHYQDHGSTPYSFWFPQPFPAPLEEAAAV